MGEMLSRPESDARTAREQFSVQGRPQRHERRDVKGWVVRGADRLRSPLLPTDPAQSLHHELALLGRVRFYEATLGIMTFGMEEREVLHGILTNLERRDGCWKFRIELEDAVPAWLAELLKEEFRTAARREGASPHATWVPLPCLIDGRVSAFDLLDVERLTPLLVYTISVGHLHFSRAMDAA